MSQATTGQAASIIDAVTGEHGGLVAFLRQIGQHTAHPALFLLGAMLASFAFVAMGYTGSLVILGWEKRELQSLEERHAAGTLTKREKQFRTHYRLNQGLYLYGWTAVAFGLFLCVLSLL